ncbi:DNA topoisomerase IV, alpha subunit [Trichodelitschia bisporula]|uniref:DNA topoisomerase (ATP-hydrolyzing) n=1 Tax=Trichodelitschia bisporula TaxID=703511 RepID=A0A6G1I3Q5_9PEZI|nr:DNA topoisomerase IV, alpha subunit [Trichodelitschia bisporula]
MSADLSLRLSNYAAPTNEANIPVAETEDSGSRPKAPPRRDSQYVLSRIEYIFESQVDALLAENKPLSVTLQIRRAVKPSGTQEDGHSKVKAIAPRFRKFEFPGKSEQEAWRYSVILRVLEIIHEALTEDMIFTKREIFYRDPALFNQQLVVDRTVDDLAFTFGVPRQLLNVTATAKGLAAGAFTIHRQDKSSVKGWLDREGTLISPIGENDTVEMPDVEWILVIEKEATFHSLAVSPFWETIKSRGIILTAKGYPDLSTRAFLRFLSSHAPHVPILGLADFDPDGIEIFSVYKHGSMALPHENAALKVPSLHYLGIDSAILSEQGNARQEQGLLQLSLRDRRRAMAMLRRAPFVEGGKEPGLRRELQVMLMLGVKAEIQVLEARDGGLVRWLKEALKGACSQNG